LPRTGVTFIDFENPDSEHQDFAGNAGERNVMSLTFVMLALLVGCGRGDPMPTSNMQWQMIVEARGEDAWERKACAR
jgi:hypothetical protein